MKGRTIKCLNNLKQIGVMTASYYTDYGWIPPLSWREAAMALGWPGDKFDYSTEPNWCQMLYQYSGIKPKGWVYVTTRIGNINPERGIWACDEAPDWPSFTASQRQYAASIGRSQVVSQSGAEVLQANSPKFPSRLAMDFDTEYNTDYSSYSPLAGSPQVLKFRHNNALNVAYMDLHADTRKYGSFRHVDTKSPFWSNNPSWWTTQND